MIQIRHSTTFRRGPFRRGVVITINLTKYLTELFVDIILLRPYLIITILPFRIKEVLQMTQAKFYWNFMLTSSLCDNTLID